MGFAIRISDALPTIKQLIKKGYASHPGLNAQSIPGIRLNMLGVAARPRIDTARWSADGAVGSREMF